MLIKYGVYPIDPGAQGKCQYSYVGTPEAEDLQPVDAETVPAEVYNLSVAEIARLKDQISEIRGLLLGVYQNSGNINPYPPSLYNMARFAANFVKKLQNTIKSHEDVIGDLNFSIDNWSKQYAELEAKLTAAEISIKDREAREAYSATCAANLAKEIEELQAQLQATAAAQEDPKAEYPVSIGLASGGEFKYVLPARMAR